MAASHSDKYILSTDPTFQSRVRSALMAYCATVITEAAATTAYHKERITRAVSIVNGPDGFKSLYANAAALDANVIADATAAGTVVLTAGNVAAQAANVTDAHIDAAI